jgi:hypothetical protein
MSSAINSPSYLHVSRVGPKFDHIYLVMRYDPFISNPKGAISALKVFLSESEAHAEAERLNQLIQKRLGDDKQMPEYYVTFARIKKELLINDTSNHGV